MEKQQLIEEVQGAEIETVKRTPGKSSTLKSLAGCIKNLKLAGLTTEEDHKGLVKIYTKIKNQYLGEDLF